jgi:hypothetical protein
MFDHAKDVLHHLVSPETRHTIGVIIDTAAVGTVIATVVGWLPQATAILTFLWAIIRLYETRTIQRWLHKKKQKRIE